MKIIPSITPSGLNQNPAFSDPIQVLFSGLGSYVVRFRFVIVVLWIAAAIGAVLFLPSLSSISNDDNAAFLPANVPSLRAALLALPFERSTLPQALLVASRAGTPLSAGDQAAITRVEATVLSVKNVAVVRDQGVSADGQVRKAQVALTARAGGFTEAQAAVTAIRSALRRAAIPGGLSLYLTGQLPTAVDQQAANSSTQSLTQLLSIVFILVLLLLVYRSALAPLLTLLPAGLVLALSGPVIAEAHRLFGVQVSSITQILLTVLLLGAGTDYGLFLVFRVREELRRGLDPHAAVIKSVSRVGETITFSAGTVIAALLCLVLATFGFYKGLGPALAIGIGIMLLAGLTLLPALLAIAGRVAFWPTNIKPGNYRVGLWGRIAGRIVQHPAPVLLAGIILFGGLALAVTKYSPSGFGGGSTSTSSESARGTSVLVSHFPAAQANPTNLLMRFATPVWQSQSALAVATRQLANQPIFRSVNGPLDPNGTHITPAQLVHLHSVLGPAAALPLVPPSGAAIPRKLYNAYRATAQFISPDGHTVQLYASLTAGDPATTSAMHAVPAVRRAMTRAAALAGAMDSGVAGEAALSYDVSAASDSDLVHIVPIVLLVIGILLAVVLRSLVAPWYLLASVGLSYLSALGLAVVVFMGFGRDIGLNFILPFLMFIFLMALGSDYNILVMTRIREEAHEHSLPEAVARAVNATGSTITSAGMVLAGSFLVLTISGGGQTQQIGFGIAAGIFMDTFLVRTLLIPSTVVLIGRWNWWPSRLAAAHIAEPALAQAAVQGGSKASE